jgi:hypothetical protein
VSSPSGAKTGETRRHPRDVPGVRLRALKEAAIAAEDLVARVARQFHESVVHVDDGIVGQPRVGDDHRHARRADGGGEGVGADDGAGDLGVDPGAVLSVVQATPIPLIGIVLVNNPDQSRGKEVTLRFDAPLAEEGTHGFPFLKKPYSVEDLSRTLRRAVSARDRLQR